MSESDYTAGPPCTCGDSCKPNALGHCDRCWRELDLYDVCRSSSGLPVLIQTDSPHEVIDPAGWSLPDFQPSPAPKPGVLVKLRQALSDLRSLPRQVLERQLIFAGWMPPGSPRAVRVVIDRTADEAELAELKAKLAEANTAEFEAQGRVTSLLQYRDNREHPFAPATEGIGCSYVSGNGFACCLPKEAHLDRYDVAALIDQLKAQAEDAVSAYKAVEFLAVKMGAKEGSVYAWLAEFHNKHDRDLVEREKAVATACLDVIEEHANWVCDPQECHHDGRDEHFEAAFRAAAKSIRHRFSIPNREVKHG